jgi:hypothetical protein
MFETWRNLKRNEAVESRGEGFDERSHLTDMHDVLSKISIRVY